MGTEDFRCAPGPMGWRYVSEIERDEPAPHRETVDVVVDASWRIVRTRIETGIARDPPGSARGRTRRASGTAHGGDGLGTGDAPGLPLARPSTRSRRPHAPADGRRPTSTCSSSSPSRSNRPSCGSGTSWSGARPSRRRGGVPRHAMAVHGARDRLDERSLGGGRGRRPLRPRVRAHLATSRGRRDPFPTPP